MKQESLTPGIKKQIEHVDSLLKIGAVLFKDSQPETPDEVQAMKSYMNKRCTKVVAILTILVMSPIWSPAYADILASVDKFAPVVMDLERCKIEENETIPALTSEVQNLNDQVQTQEAIIKNKDAEIAVTKKLADDTEALRLKEEARWKEALENAGDSFWDDALQILGGVAVGIAVTIGTILIH